MPFSSLQEMYYDTDFRLALRPSTTFEDNFKYSSEEIFQKIYKDRLEPHLEEYAAFPNVSFDMMHFIKNDPTTALYNSYIPIRQVIL